MTWPAAVGGKRELLAMTRTGPKGAEQGAWAMLSAVEEVA